MAGDKLNPELKRFIDNAIVPILVQEWLEQMGKSQRTRRLPKLDVPIGLTGAMSPLGFEQSDGLQKLTESLMAVQFLKLGVCFVIHGTCYPVGCVRKDHGLGRFVWTDDRNDR